MNSVNGLSAISWEILLVTDGGVNDRVFYRKNADYKRYQIYAQTTDLNANALDILDGNDYVITINEFPYNLAPGIHHYIFWMQPGKKCDIESAREIANKCIRPSDLIIFENSSARQSIQSVPHYQIFVRF